MSPCPKPLFAVVFPCLCGLLLQYFYGLSFLAMWAQIEGLLAIKMAMSLLFDYGWWTLCPLARPDSDMGQWVVPTQQLFWFWAEVPWIPGDKALFVSLSPLPDTQPFDSRCCQPEQWGQASCSPSAWPEMPSCQENGDGSPCSNLIIHHCQAKLLPPKDGPAQMKYLFWWQMLPWIAYGDISDEGVQKVHCRKLLIPQEAFHVQAILGPSHSGWLLGLCGHHPISEDSDWFLSESVLIFLLCFIESVSEADR